VGHKPAGQIPSEPIALSVARHWRSVRDRKPVLSAMACCYFEALWPREISTFSAPPNGWASIWNAEVRILPPQPASPVSTG